MIPMCEICENATTLQVIYMQYQKSSPYSIMFLSHDLTTRLYVKSLCLYKLITGQTE